MRRIGWSWAALGFTIFAIAACERDVTPNAEPAKTRAPAAAAPVNAAPAPALPHADNAKGACGADDKGGCGCGDKAGGCGSGCGDKHAKAGGCGCGSAAKAEAPAEAPVVPITEAKVGDRTLCPVMNTVFLIKPDSPKYELAGKTYY